MWKMWGQVGPVGTRSWGQGAGGFPWTKAQRESQSKLGLQSCDETD